MQRPRLRSLYFELLSGHCQIENGVLAERSARDMTIIDGTAARSQSMAWAGQITLKTKAQSIHGQEG